MRRRFALLLLLPTRLLAQWRERAESDRAAWQLIQERRWWDAYDQVAIRHNALVGPWSAWATSARALVAAREAGRVDLKLAAEVQERWGALRIETAKFHHIEKAVSHWHACEGWPE